MSTRADQPTRRIVLSMISTLLLAATTFGGVPFAAASLQGTPGKIGIVLQRNLDDPGEIIVISPDNPAPHDLGQGSALAWSPDGKRIAFNSQRDGNFEIYTVNADGSDLRRLTNNPASDVEPVWSPDGKKILYTSVPGNQHENEEIFVMNADGSDPHQLTNNKAADEQAAWSPDGTRIVFMSERDTPRDPKSRSEEVYVMNADGSNQRRLTRSWSGQYAGYSSVPSWSPDGTHIAFLSARNNEKYLSIYVMDADGSNLVRLLDLHDFAGIPVWSPDSKRIAFNAGPGGQPNGVYVMDADGSNMKRLADGRFPSWSPDGAQLVYVFLRDYDEKKDQGAVTINVMNADGSNAHKLAELGAGSVYSYAGWGR